MYLISISDQPAVEQAILDQATKVCSHVAMRRDRPSYGYTKGMIRHEAGVLDGMIGLYMILSGQSTHPGVPSLAEFRSTEITERVATARKLVSEL